MSSYPHQHQQQQHSKLKRKFHVMDQDSTEYDNNIAKRCKYDDQTTSIDSVDDEQMMDVDVFQCIETTDVPSSVFMYQQQIPEAGTNHHAIKTYPLCNQSNQFIHTKNYVITRGERGYGFHLP
jgi:hypothetical protein